jgi:hypothetical protein
VTTEQLEWSTIFWGMLGEGCSTEEALSYILVMECPTNIYSWLLGWLKDNKLKG